MKLEKGQFIEVSYTGKIEDGTVFDTTDPEVAKDLQLQREVRPIIICLGEGQLLKGLDEALIGKEGDAHTINLEAEKAFGKKSSKLLQMVPLPQLKKQNIDPHPGMELNIDGKYGVVKSAASGRVVVDFNHPLASHDVSYDVRIIREVTEKKDQVESILDTGKIPFEEVTLNGDDVTIFVKELYPQPLMDAIQKKVGELTKANNVSFEKK